MIEKALRSSTELVAEMPAAPPAAAGEYERLTKRLKRQRGAPDELTLQDRYDTADAIVAMQAKVGELERKLKYYAGQNFKDREDALAAAQARIAALEEALTKIGDTPVSYSAETLRKIAYAALAKGETK